MAHSQHGVSTRNQRYPNTSEFTSLKSLFKYEAATLLLINFLFFVIFFCITEAHLDTPGDMVENYAWGITWSLGNNKHPPLFSWITSAWFYIFPTKDWAYYLLSSLNMLIASSFLLMSLHEVLEKKKAFIALALSVVVLPLSLDHGYKYNANLAQLPFITAYLWALITAIKSQHQYKYAIAGLMAGAAILCKYSAVLFLGPITLTVWICFSPGLARFSKGLLTVCLISFITLVPHIYWEAQHHWISLNYMHSKPVVTGWHWLALGGQNLADILRFLSVPLIILILGVISSAPSIKTVPAQPFKAPKLGLIIFMLSLICTFLGAYIENLKPDSSWFIVCTIFGGWALVDLLPENLNFNLLTIRIKQLVYGYLLIALIGALYLRVADNNNAIHQAALPEVFAQDLTNYFQNHYHERISYVAGSHPLAYDVTFYSADHPIGVYGVNVNGSPWVDLDRFKKSSKIIVCTNLKSFFPKDPLCSKDAVELLGPPSEEKLFSYKAYDAGTKHDVLVKFNTLIYR